MWDGCLSSSLIYCNLLIFSFNWHATLLSLSSYIYSPDSDLGTFTGIIQKHLNVHGNLFLFSRAVMTTCPHPPLWEWLVGVASAGVQHLGVLLVSAMSNFWARERENRERKHCCSFCFWLSSTFQSQLMSHFPLVAPLLFPPKTHALENQTWCNWIF